MDSNKITKSGKFQKRESGAIALMAVFSAIVIIMVTALVIDFGLYYNRGAKLQNAVDAAAVAVASELGSTDLDMEVIARNYLAKNGFKSENNDIDVVIETKGVLTEETIQEDDEKYITSGYMKLTVSLTNKTNFASVLGFKNLTQTKNSFVKVTAHYVDAPRALKYTLFAGATNAQTPAMVLGGRTGPLGNSVADTLQQTINSINKNLVQPIIGILGGVPDYSDLVHFNTSEIITNGDVHSNSNIKVDVQALNASRVKDDNSVSEYVYQIDENGNMSKVPETETIVDAEGNPQEVIKKDENGNIIYKTTTVEMNRGDASYDDYGQVTYTAVDDIKFTVNPNIILGTDIDTHLYVQNQQYLEQTQATLGILNLIDYSAVGSTGTLKDQYNAVASSYFNGRNLSQKQKDNILNQANRLDYDNNTNTITVDKQYMLVYDINHNTANALMADADSQIKQAKQEALAEGRTLSTNPVLEEVVAANEEGKDPIFATNLVPNTDAPAGTPLKYLNYSNADGYNGEGINYDITIKTVSDENESKDINVDVKGTRVDRNTDNLISVAGDPLSDSYAVSSVDPALQAGAKYALSSTFQQNLGDNGFIPTPNMRPYFARQVNQSIANSTKTSADFNNPDAAGDASIRKAVARMTKELNQVLDKAEYKDDTFNDASTLSSYDTTPLFKTKKTGENEKPVALSDEESKKYNGINLYKDGKLRNASSVIKEFADDNTNNLDKNDRTTTANYGLGAINQFYKDNVADPLSLTKTKYGKDKVDSKRRSLNLTVGQGYTVKKAALIAAGKNRIYTYAGAMTDNFLGNSDRYAPRQFFNSQFNVNFDTDAVYDSSSHTLTLNNNLKWPDGTNGAKTLTTSSSDRNMTNHYYDGNISTTGKSAYLTGPSYAFIKGDVTSNKSWSGGGGHIDCGQDKNSGALLFVTGNMSCSYQLQIRANSTVICLGNVSCNNLLLEDGAKLYVKGNLSIGTGSHHDTANGLVYVGGSITTNSTDGYFSVNGKIVCAGDFSLDVDKDYTSLRVNDTGSIFVGGNISSKFKMIFKGGDLYCAGTVNACYTDNTNGNSTNMMDIVGDSRIFVGGRVTSDQSKSTNRHIYIHDEDGYNNTAVFSVFGCVGGSFVTDIITGQTDELCNGQAGCNVYLASGDDDPNRAIYFTGNSTLFNYGNMYVYNSLHLSECGAMDLQNAGTTFIDGYLYAEKANVTVGNGHTFVVGKQNIDPSVWDARINSVSVSGNSKAWFFGRLDCKSLSVETTTEDAISEIFCGENSLLGNAYGASTSLIINGKIYIPEIEYFPLNKLDVGKFGSFFYDGDLTVSDYFLVRSGGTYAITGKTTIINCTVTNNGNMYSMGGLDTSQSNAGEKSPDMTLGDENGSYPDTFIGKNVNGTLELKSYYRGQGTVYIDNDLVIKGWGTTNDVVPNRGESFMVLGGETHVSGNVVNSDNSASYTAENTVFSCGGNLVLGSAFYDLGQTYVLGNLSVSPTATDYSDKGNSEYEKGISLAVGGKSKVTSSVLFVNGSNDVELGGYVLNSGKLYVRGNLKVMGKNIPESSMKFGSRITRTNDYPNYAPNISITTYANSVTQCGGKVETKGVVYNGTNAIFATQGNVEYGQALLNGGKFIAMGEVKYSQNCHYVYHIEVFANAGLGSTVTGDKKGSYSIVNGYGDDGAYNSDAVFYAGSGITLGTTEDQTNTDAVGGTFQNWGTAYISGDLNVFSKKELAYNMSSILAQQGSKTYLKGGCISSGVTAIMTDTTFMCDKDFVSKRTVKANLDQQFNNNHNYNTGCYIYIGGNMIVNSMGMASNASTNDNTSRDMDIYPNTNIYVDGSFYANCQVYMKQNVKLLIAGNKSLSESSSRIESDFRATKLISKLYFKNLADSGDYGFIATQSIDQNIFAELIISNGGMYVNDTCKIRDCTNTYVNGKFTCHDYVELGKALDGYDETEAADTYKLAGENRKKYSFKNAAKMYVKDDFYSLGYTRLYASSSLIIGGDFETLKYLTLRHDAKINVGKKLKAATSIDGGSYSEFNVLGSMQATTSTIKLRDCTTVNVGGNMTALSYIELGKAGDYTREVSGNTVNESWSDGKITESETVEDGYDSTENGDVGEDKNNENNASKCGCCENCPGVTHGLNSAKDGTKVSDKSQECGCLSCIYRLACGCCSSCTDSADCECECVDCEWHTKVVDASNELASDSSDKAKGGTFYIGQNLMSYTGYIKEYAYSRVAVGNVVFALNYITLRHNADMWVMPETFSNATYKYQPYIPSEDRYDNIWNYLVDKIKETAHEINEAVKPKTGSVYSLGELTLNKNASLMGTWDCTVQGQCVFRQDSLVYMGNNFNCYAQSFNLSKDALFGDQGFTGFFSRGTASGSTNKTTFPVVIFAGNEINIMTTIDMAETYLVANNDVNIWDIYTKSENAENNAKQLPNAICSYTGNINYFAVYGKMGALFYAPNGNLNLDGYYMEIWGCGIGNTVNVDTYYLALHRFTNWRTMQLNIAESGSVHLIPKHEYEQATNNVDGMNIYDRNDSNENYGGADLFFNFNEDGSINLGN